MALNPLLVYQAPFTEQIWDKDLNVPLAGGIVSFFRDADNATPKNVYQLVGSGPGGYSYINLGSTLTLSGIGTFVDGSGNNLQVYLYPYTGAPTDVTPSGIVDLYYISVQSSTLVPQFTVNAWPPGITANASPSNVSATTDNIITNSQFVEVIFDPTATSSTPITYSTTGTNTATQIAPDWSIVTNGTGNFSVYQVPIANTSVPGNPAYALGVTSSGYANPVVLRQRLLAPRIFSGDFVSGSFVVESQDSGIHTITMSYVPSGTGTPQTICTGATPTTGFVTIANATAVTITAGATGQTPSSYVDITITIPVGAAVQVSCIQLCGVASSTQSVSYLQNTPAEEINGLFHYYEPQLKFKPVPSLLTGWDFPLNPAQLGSSQTGSTTPAYIWDQTIAQSKVGNLTIISDSATGALSITTNNNLEAFYILQYLSGAEALETTLSNLAVNLFGLASANNVAVQVQLFYSSANGTIPSVLTAPSTIGTIAYNSGLPVFTLTAVGWTQVPQFAGFKNLLTMPTSAADLGFLGFNGLANFASASTTKNFAIVVSFGVPTTGTTIKLNSVSLVPGDIATRPAPQTLDEVLRECQYYYRKSFLPGQVPTTGVGTGTGESYAVQAVGASTANSGPFVRFDYPMIATPTTLLINPVTANNQIYNETAGLDCSSSVVVTSNKISFACRCTTPAGGTSLAGNLLGVHWTADARLATP